MPFEKDYNDQAKVVKYLLTAQKELAKLQKEMSDGDKVQAELIKEKQREVTKLNKIYKDNAKVIKESVSDFEDMDDTMTSIGNQMKKNNKFADEQAKSFTKVKLVAASIAAELADGGVKNKKTSQQVVDAQNAYKNMHTSIADINREFALGRVSNDERIQQIKQQSEAFQDVISKVDMASVSSEALKDQLELMNNEGKSFAELMKKSQIQSERLDSVFDSFSGIPALGEVNTLLKTNIKDTIAFKAAVFALGAALGKAAMDYFGAPIKAAMQADKEIQQGRIDGIAERAKIQSDANFISNDEVVKGTKNYTKIQEESDNNRIDTAHNVAQAMNEAAFAGQRAANAFSASMQTGAAQFQRAAKTALFGKSIGSIGYGAAQMQLAGIGADKIASAMESAGAATGKMPTAKAAADMAVMAERTGQSVDDIAGINEAFQRMDGMSAEVAMNMQEGMRNMADQAGIGLGNLMKEVAEASKEALGYQIKSGPALAKAVAYTQSMGLNFGDVAKAGKNMVMNYKDSIKAEMQLSSLLGEQVDLSEVRAKFAAGDQAGALESLKAQGLDPADMDMFQQQALQDSLGGMDLSSLSKVATNTGKSGGNLAAGDAKAGNQGFLTKTQQAEASLESQTAQISANQAVVDAQLSGQIADSFINSPGHKKFLEAQAAQAVKSQQLAEAQDKLFKSSDAYRKQLEDTAKLNFVEDLKSTLLGGIGAVLGGLATTGLSKLIPGGGKGGGLMSMFSGGKGGGGGAEAGGGVAGAASSLSGAAPGGKAGGGMLKGATNGIKGVSSVLQTLTKEIGGVLNTLIKTLQSVGNQLITSVSDMLKKVLTSVKSLGGQLADTLGSVVGKIVDNVGTVLTKASDIVIKIGTKLADGVGKILSKIGSGLGKGIGALIEGVLTGLAAGLKAFANPQILIGAGILAASITAIGAGIAGAAYLLGKTLPTLAEGFMAFNSINGDNLKSVGVGVAALGVGMAAMGAGAVLSGIGNLVGSLFGGGIEDTIKKVEKFAEANINADKVKNNADAIIAYSKAMAASGLGNAASGLGNLVGGIANGIASFFGAKTTPPLKEMAEFGKLNIGNPEKIKQNAEVFTAFGNAMASYKGSSGSVGGMLGDALGSFFKVKPPLQAMKEFAAEDFGKDKEKIKQNAEAFTLFGNAMASYDPGKSTGLMSVLAEGVAGFLNVPSPLDKFKEFAAIDGIDPAKVKTNADAFVLFGNAMKSYEGSGEGFWSSLGEGISSFFGGGDGDLITKFQRFAALDAGGVTAISTAIGSFNANLSGFSSASAEAVGTGMASVATATTDYLTADRTAAVNSFASSIGYLNSQLMGLAGIAPLLETTTLAFINLASALDRLAEVNISAVNDLPWIRMTAFAAAGGKIVLAQSANNSFNIAQDTAKNIEKLTTDTKANVQIAKNLQALLGVLAENKDASFSLNIDGSAVTRMISKREADRKAGLPNP